MLPNIVLNFKSMRYHVSSFLESLLFILEIVFGLCLFINISFAIV